MILSICRLRATRRGPTSCATTTTFRVCSSLYVSRFVSETTYEGSVAGHDAGFSCSSGVQTALSLVIAPPHSHSERRIAFILYLVPEDWDASTDGGSLDLFSVVPGSNGTVPDRIVTSLSPKWNSMAFFEVSHVSHHQVRSSGCGVFALILVIDINARRVIVCTRLSDLRVCRRQFLYSWAV